MTTKTKINFSLDSKLLEKMQTDEQVLALVKGLKERVSGVRQLSSEESYSFDENHSYFLQNYASETAEVKRLYAKLEREGWSRELFGKISKMQTASVYPLLIQAGLLQNV